MGARVRQSPTFASLARRADHWVPMMEVRPEHVAAYLAERQAEGYTLVGLEQCTGSKPLHRTRLPRRSVLVLGNEAQGMPADLLSMLELLIEIPHISSQTRSLNVHVAGAIVIWEATKQHLLLHNDGGGHTE